MQGSGTHYIGNLEAEHAPTPDTSCASRMLPAGPARFAAVHELNERSTRRADSFPACSVDAKQVTLSCEHLWELEGP
jgi:hypothetical protein